MLLRIRQTAKVFNVALMLADYNKLTMKLITISNNTMQIKFGTRKQLLRYLNRTRPDTWQFYRVRQQPEDGYTTERVAALEKSCYQSQ